jgi:DNA modification methylase
MTYEDFLQTKVPKAQMDGFEPLTDPHESLKPHQIDIARWAARGGRRAIFAAFGLGKTRIHLQVAKWTVEHDRKRDRKYLIVAPLGVRHVFTREDGPAMGINVEYCRNDAEVQASGCDIIITNYERVRDGGITLSPDVFCGAGLDEASVLRSFGSKTYQTFLGLFANIRYRFVFTATPSPNRHKELIHYGGFLGVMDSGEALTRFFKRDSEQANNLTLYPHMEERFWLWLSSWAVFLQKPGDLGYSNEGYDLPEMNLHWHMVGVDHTKAWNQTDSWGQSQLFLDQSSGLREVAEAKRETILARVQKAQELMGPEGFVVDPAETIHDQVIDAALSHVEDWQVLRSLLAGKSWGESFGTGGGSQPVRWEGHAKGLTYYQDDKPTQIKPAAIAKRVFQYRTGFSKHWLLWHDLEAERHLIEELIPGAKTVYGSQDLDEREELILGFSRGAFPVLATKPIIAGSGCNFQKHCADAIFLGSTYKFNDFIQAVHRVYRFQQTQEVNIHVIFSESESPVIETLKAKWTQHNQLVEKMAEILRTYRLTMQDMKLTRSLNCGRSEVAGKHFRMINNDCVQELRDWPAECTDLVVTSIPFGNQYEYSPSYQDFGHNPDNAAFFEQMDFLVPSLLRVLRPGRLACIHVKDRIRFGNVTGLGMPTVDPFSDDTVASFRKHGFAFMGRITIDTDVVRENNQTWRLGWSENAKDSTKMGVGMPEYVLLFRKLPTDLSDAYADVPVAKDKSIYTRAKWQIDAASFWKSSGNRLPDPESLVNIPHDGILRLWREHAAIHGYDYDEHIEIGKELEKREMLPASFMLFPPISNHPGIWTDISRMRVLNSEQQKRHAENHVCPLQLDIVERLITRYSNPGETVMDPFAGIGTVPQLAVKMGRDGWGVELSTEYWRCGVGYCEAAEADRDVPTLFDMMAEVAA